MTHESGKLHFIIPGGRSPRLALRRVPRVLAALGLDRGDAASLLFEDVRRAFQFDAKGVQRDGGLRLVLKCQSPVNTLQNLPLDFCIIFAV